MNNSVTIPFEKAAVDSLTWVDGKGNKICVSKLTNDNLDNIFNYLIRKSLQKFAKSTDDINFWQLMWYDSKHNRKIMSEFVVRNRSLYATRNKAFRQWLDTNRHVVYAYNNRNMRIAKDRCWTEFKHYQHYLYMKNTQHVSLLYHIAGYIGNMLSNLKKMVKP